MRATTEKKRIAALVEMCVANGIREVVISPGSRNAPIIIALESHPEVNTYLIHDERVAAFFALGLAESNMVPVMLTCTSGSAPLNYAPAIVEAYYRQIPLFILTADRPPELIDQGDGQTMRQKGLYSNYIKSQYSLGLEDNDMDIIVPAIDKVISDVLSIPSGPVHLNIPLHEPLYKKENFELDDYTPTELIESKKLEKHLKKQMETDWNESENILLIIGQNPDKELLELIRPLLEQSNIAVVTENTSNVVHYHKICHCIDRALARISKNELTSFVPDLLITCGGAIISKRIKTFLRKNKPKKNWRIGEFLIQEDTYQSLTLTLPVKPNVAFRYVLNFNQKYTTNFGNKWKEIDLQADHEHQKFLGMSTTFSDLKVVETVLDFLPENSNLHMGNSSVVRYCQLFNPISSINYFSNRGVSGIDGSLSTGLGIAHRSKDKLNTIILGDISFMYDSNGLWLEYLNQNTRIIVINNGGGGIFKILPEARKSEHHQRFFAHSEARIEGLANTFNLEYTHVESMNELEAAMSCFFAFSENNRPKILEINTSKNSSEIVLNEYFKYIEEH